MIEIHEKEFIALVEFMKNNYGINLFHKKTLVESRLSNFMTEKKIKDYKELLNYVFTDKSGKFIKDLINLLTTNLTYFMREVEHFRFLRTVVLPYLENNIKDKDLRVWSAGCSSGQEAYTLAVEISEYFGNKKKSWDTRVLATDISETALKKAVNGIYTSEEIEGLPDIWKSKYLNELGDGKYQVVDEIRNQVIFSPFNLMEEVYPFKKDLHVIFCRNVMIYFDNETKTKIVKKFYDKTSEGGYLFIGHSESITNFNTDYSYIIPAVYRKEKRA
ncbi:MAG: CheR family methyltransferase [Deltaproteobacteria bacterium]